MTWFQEKKEDNELILERPSELRTHKGMWKWYQTDIKLVLEKIKRLGMDKAQTVLLRYKLINFPKLMVSHQLLLYESFSIFTNDSQC